MSNTIQARHYAAERAVLHQKRPSEIIDAAENVMEDAQGSFMRTLYALNVQPSHSAKVTVVSSRGDDKPVRLSTKMIYCVAWPTAASEESIDLDEYHLAETSWSRWAGQAKEALQKGASSERRPSTAAASLRVGRLSALQAAFGFTIQDLAAVLGITRPQLYKWLDAANCHEPWTGTPDDGRHLRCAGQRGQRSVNSLMALHRDR